MKLSKLNCTVILFLFGLFIMPGQSIASENNPNIFSIPAYDYHAGKKNWGLAHDSQGNLYVANNDGLLRYDGLQWLFIESGSIIRSIAVGPEDRVYTGGYKDFGYWEKDLKGMLKYHSLSKSIIGEMDSDEEIWKIVVRKEGIYFQSFSHIYFYDYKRVTTLPSVGFILFLQDADKKLLIEGHGKLYEVNETSIVPLTNLPVTMIHQVLEHKDGLLMCSAKEGIWLLNQGVVKEWNLPLNQKLKNVDINCGLKLSGGNYMIGTLSNGIYEINSQAEIVRHYSIENGLRSNTILSILLDGNNNVWIGTDNGISKLEYDDRFHFLRDPNRKLGSVHSTALLDDRLYMGTNKGLYILPYSKTMSQHAFDYLYPVPNGQGQVWNLQTINGRIYMAHQKGLFEVDAETLKPLYTANGVQALKELSIDQDTYLLATTYNRLLVFKKDNQTNSFVFLREFPQDINVSTSIEIDNQGNIWFGHEFKGFSCYRLTREKDELLPVNINISGNSKLDNALVKVTSLNGRIVLISDGISYTYDDLNHQIVPFQPLNTKGKFITNPQLLQQIDKDHYWLVGKSEWALLKANQNDLEIVDHLHFNDPSIETVDGYEAVCPINDSTSIINLMNGILIYNSSRSVSIDYLNNRLSLSFVEAYSVKGVTDTLQIVADSEIVLPFAFNNISFHVAGSGLQNMHNSYQYKLEGMDNSWSPVSRSGIIQFDRLPYGKYTLLINSIHEENSKFSAGISDVVYHFQILPPWYLRWYSILIYVLIYLSVILLIIQFYKQRHLKQLRRQEELEEQMRIMQEKQKLESDLHEKNSKLVEITSTTIKKNELLNNVKEEIDAFVSKNPSASISTKLSKITRTINAPALTKDDWSLFVMQFEASHPTFFRDVKNKYPSLTPSELKLAACLKLNLTTKDIAALLNISVRGVEVSRYRLRKKISLESTENLNEFFIRNF
ncbi:MAG: two-component regulator propeller domain-containing protein [Bacteroidales bacterium]